MRFALGRIPGDEPEVQTRVLREIQRLIRGGLDGRFAGYRARPGGGWYFSGPPRGPGWHRHGTTRCAFADLRGGELVRIVLYKQRWREVATGRTEHDRPPDQVGRRRYAAVVIAVALAGWLLSGAGVHRHQPLLHGLRDLPVARTLQRWRQRAAAHAADLEQGVRRAWLDLKPRQAGDDVPGGIPPPLRIGPWRGRADVDRLSSALSMVLGSAVALNKSSASLLAEARRRLPDRPFLTD